MTDSSDDRRAIDDAIDRAVREMMLVDPRPGLRRRVLARLGRAAARPTGVWSLSPLIHGSRGSWVLFPAVAVVMVVGAVVFAPFVDKPAQVPQAPSPYTPGARSTPVTPSATSPPPAPLQSTRSRERLRASDSIFGPPRDRVSASSVDRAVTASSSLVPFVVEDAPSRLTPIVLTALPHVDEIRVAPIQIQRITVPALAPPR